MTAAEKVRFASVSVRRQKTVALADVILEVFDAFDGPMSTRQVFYQCVSRLAIQNSQRDYDRVQRLLVEMRRRGEVPFDRVVDRTRRKHHQAGWDGVSDILDTVAATFRRDYWADQPRVVMIACEKQALEGIFAREVDRYGASLWVCRGYPSEAYLFEWAAEIQLATRDGKRVVVPYFGDLDPSGLDIERAVREGLERHGARAEFFRAGLRRDDLETYQIPPLPVKATDRRAAAYIREHGNVAAELDALPPAALRSRIESIVETYVDPVRWAAIQRAEREERASLDLVARNWARAVAGVTANDDGGAS